MVCRHFLKTLPCPECNEFKLKRKNKYLKRTLSVRYMLDCSNCGAFFTGKVAEAMSKEVDRRAADAVRQAQLRNPSRGGFSQNKLAIEEDFPEELEALKKKLNEKMRR